MPISKEEFRRALGHFAAAVTVVTTKLDDDRRAGITVTAFSSLSLEPPLVLVCIDKRASLHDALTKGHAFAVNILKEDQELVSRRFASSQGDQFEDVGATEGASGSPLLVGALTTIECRVVDRLPGGDHTIVVGEVESGQVNEGKPLVYFRGGYAQLG
jgi:flavin reductase (DIM6/NTAB) family NADH-FMN oxidoreductase RutF